MSKFNKYAKQADEIAKESFKAYKEAAEALKKAEDQQRTYPERAGIVTAEYAAKSARAKADYLTAKENMKAAQRNMESVYRQIQQIKRDLAADLDSSFAADPAQIDPAVMDLLKSGILKPAEYERLYNSAASADNHTMMRIIGKYAKDVADAENAKHVLSAQDAATLRVLAANSRNITGSEYLDSYHAIEDVYDRCTRNPGMIDHWDELLSEIVTDF